jgi:hypothetical protein
MPDQKITQCLEHVTAVLGADLLPLVGNTGTTPTNYRVQVKNFLSQITIDLPQTAYSALHITAEAVANANAVVQSAAQFDMVANSINSWGALDRYGLIVNNLIQNGNSNVVGQMASAMFTLDTGNAATVTTNTFGVLIRHYSNTAPRSVAPRAFIGVQEDANTGAATTYLLDVGAGGKLVSQNTASANATPIFTKVGSASATHVLKCRVNGVDLWVLASNVAPA